MLKITPQPVDVRLLLLLNKFLNLYIFKILNFQF